MPVVEFLVQRGATVNHRNASGNTALHFAMSYDTSGKMGEYLINNGADDTIENKQGLSPCEYRTAAALDAVCFCVAMFLWWYCCKRLVY